MSVAPESIPDGMLTERQRRYFHFATCISWNVMGGCLPMQWLNGNLFGSLVTNSLPLVVNVTWDEEELTVCALHTVCGAILRRIVGLEDYSKESVMNLLTIQTVLSQEKPIPIEADTGRLRSVRYEDVGERIDLRPFWSPGNERGKTEFNWIGFKESGLDWMLAKPDVFPRFHAFVAPRRFAGFTAPSQDTINAITRLPFDVLSILLPHLTNESFVHLLSACRLLRYHALTTFQSHARDRVIALGWAVPLPKEYARATTVMNKDGKPSSVLMASSDIDVNGVDADWFLYLSQVHRTQAMRMRRHLWALGEEVKRAYDEQLPLCEEFRTVDVAGNSYTSETMKRFKSFIDTTYSMGLLFNREPGQGPGSEPFTMPDLPAELFGPV